MLFKYFLDMTPEESAIESSSLTKFRKLRLQDKNLKNIMPTKVSNGVLEDEIEYCKKLIIAINNNEIIANYPSEKERINLLKKQLRMT